MAIAEKKKELIEQFRNHEKDTGSRRCRSPFSQNGFGISRNISRRTNGTIIRGGAC